MAEPTNNIAQAKTARSLTIDLSFIVPPAEIIGSKEWEITVRKDKN